MVPVPPLPEAGRVRQELVCLQRAGREGEFAIVKWKRVALTKPDLLNTRQCSPVPTVLSFENRFELIII